MRRQSDPFNQNFRKFQSKTQWIGSVPPEKFKKKTGPPFEVDHFSQSVRSEFWLNGSHPKGQVPLEPLLGKQNIQAKEVYWNNKYVYCKPVVT